jgi:hypothetical protein
LLEQLKLGYFLNIPKFFKELKKGLILSNPFQKNNNVHTYVQQASLCINKGFETAGLNMGFKFKHFYDIGLFECVLWRKEDGSERKGRV